MINRRLAERKRNVRNSYEQFISRIFETMAHDFDLLTRSIGSWKFIFQEITMLVAAKRSKKKKKYSAKLQPFCLFWLNRVLCINKWKTFRTVTEYWNVTELSCLRFLGNFEFSLERHNKFLDDYVLLILFIRANSFELCK